MLRDVLMLGHPGLRREADEIDDFDGELEMIISDLRDTLHHLQGQNNMGRALAAPQIGYHKQVIYCDSGDKELIMVNPDIVNMSEDKFSVWDSCFSFDLSFFVKIRRHTRIEVEFEDGRGESREELFEGEMSELFQHEIDHLHGILATDHLGKRTAEGENIVMREEWERRFADL